MPVDGDSVGALEGVPVGDSDGDDVLGEFV